MGLGYLSAELQGRKHFEEAQLWTSEHNYIEQVYAPFSGKKIILHDVTLRDGEQTPGVVFTEKERIRIAEALAEMGVQRIEVGMPIVSEEVRRSIKAIVKANLPTEPIAFCRSVNDDIELSVDCGVKTIIVEHPINPYICINGYKISEEEMLERIINAINYAHSLGLKAMFMGWDAFRTPLSFLEKAYKRIWAESHPESIIIVDTFGVAIPDAVTFVLNKVKEWIPECKLEFHGHNDLGMATASALAAVKAGVDCVHSAVNGLGERTGNASTEQVAASLKLLLGIDTGINLRKAKTVSGLVSEISKFKVAPNAPVVGDNIFLLETGVVTHIQGKLVEAGLAPGMAPFGPSLMGQKDSVLVLGKGSGKTTIDFYLKKMGVEASDELMDELVERVKQESIVRKSLVSEEWFRELVESLV